jgi:hypothetical protein
MMDRSATDKASSAWPVAVRCGQNVIEHFRRTVSQAGGRLFPPLAPLWSLNSGRELGFVAAEGRPGAQAAVPLIQKHRVQS